MGGLKRLFFLPDRTAGRRDQEEEETAKGEEGTEQQGCGLSVCHRTAALHGTAATDRHMGSGSRGGRTVFWGWLAEVWERRGGAEFRPPPPLLLLLTPPLASTMELENIVANTVLLKAREGKDGPSGTDPCYRMVTPHPTPPHCCPIPNSLPTDTASYHPPKRLPNFLKFYDIHGGSDRNRMSAKRRAAFEWNEPRDLKCVDGTS